MWWKLFICFVIVAGVDYAKAQSYENSRCRCVCPSMSTVTNSTESDHLQRFQRISVVPPKQCNCENVILPHISKQIKGKEMEFCPRCECKYENRNTNIIKFVVIIVIWVISILVIYMAFLIILDPWLNKRNKGNYQEHMNEEDETAAGVSGPMSHNMSVRDLEPSVTVSFENDHSNSTKTEKLAPLSNEYTSNHFVQGSTHYTVIV